MSSSLVGDACRDATGDPVKAVTYDLQEVADDDRATDFEALGGKLIELPAGDWREVVTAG